MTQVCADFFTYGFIASSYAIPLKTATKVVWSACAYDSGLLVPLIPQGKGEFTMEYLEHSPVSQDVQMQLVNTYKATKGAE